MPENETEETRPEVKLYKCDGCEQMLEHVFECPRSPRLLCEPCLGKKPYEKPAIISSIPFGEG